TPPARKPHAAATRDNVCTYHRVTPSRPKRAKNAAPRNSRNTFLLDQGRPCRIGSTTRRQDASFVAARDIDGPNLRATSPFDGAGEHQHAAIGRPGRALILPAVGN